MSAEPNAAASSAPGGKVTCVTSDHEKIDVDIGALQLSHTFNNMYKDLALDGDTDVPWDFSVSEVEARVFKKVVDWCMQHKGEPDAEIVQDPDTREREWFVFNAYEVPVQELQELVMAANILDIKSLYYYGIQAIAAVIKRSTPDEVRAIFGCEDDLTDEEKAEIRKQNPCCKH